MAQQTLTDLKNKLLQIRQDIAQQKAEIVTEMANSFKAIAERNIISAGFGAKYSDKHAVPAFFLETKAVNNAGRAFLKRASKKATLVNWQDLREAQGMQTMFVDLYYKGVMWKNIVVVSTKVEGDSATATLGGKTQQAQQEMNWNRDRYGDFLNITITQQDKDFVKQVAADKINAIFKRVNL